MDTQILQNNIEQKNVNINNGLLCSNEEIDSYQVKSKMNTSSSEAELYICEKDNKKYVLKYYLNCKPKKEILENLKKIESQNVVKLYDFGEYKERCYEVLEYAEGGALNAKDANGKYKYLPLSEDAVIKVTKEIINGFQDCHKVGIVHRDIKPGNIFYKNKNGEDILIGDFGISSYVDVSEGMSKHLTQTTARTEGYFAPEAYSGVIGSEIDYYALGVTLWELLTGMEPFVNSEGKPLFPGQIVNETIQGKVVENLLARSPNLSLKMKTLIRGLMTIRHDKRWNYESVSKFLNGEDITVFSEVNQLPPLKINKVECTSYKEIAEELLKDKNFGKSFIYKGNLTRYLVKINQELATDIADKLDEYSANNNLDEGLLYVAYKICPNLGFKISDTILVCSIKDIEQLLKDNPNLIIPYLTDISKGFYDYLKIIGMNGIAEKLYQLMITTGSTDLLATKILLAFNNNQIKPFKDGINDDIQLCKIEDFEALSENLKIRLMFFVDFGNQEVCAWFENVSEKNITSWRSLSTKTNFEKENISKLDFFCLYFIKNYKPSKMPKNTNELFSMLESVQSNDIITNLLIDCYYEKLFLEEDYENCIKLLDMITNETDVLTNNVDFYIAKTAECYLRLGKSIKAFKLLKKSQKLNPNVAEYYILGSDAALKAKNNQDAFDMAEKAVSLAPNNCFALFVKGNILAVLGRNKEAIAAFTLALEIDEYKDFYEKRAEVYETLVSKGAPDLKQNAENDRAKAKNVKKELELTIKSIGKSELRKDK